MTRRALFARPEGEGVETRVLLTGLRAAAHLNGRAGRFRRVDPTNPARHVIVLEDGSEVTATHVFECCFNLIT